MCLVMNTTLYFITLWEVGRCPLFSLLPALGGRRSRFRSGRFGGGGAAGELVLDRRRCPVLHLDGPIVLQSQLSSSENGADLHSKKPQMQVHLWCVKSSGDNGTPSASLLSSFALPDVQGACLPVCTPTQTWQSGYQTAGMHQQLTIHPLSLSSRTIFRISTLVQVGQDVQAVSDFHAQQQPFTLQ